MGTSKSFPTPSGGKWTAVKTRISEYLRDSGPVTANRVIGAVLRAGGIASTRQMGGRGGGASGSGTSGGGSGGRSISAGSASVGRAVSGLGTFAAITQTQGLDQGLQFLGLSDLQGKSAAEVIARIAEHLTDGSDGIQQELLTNTLRDAIFEVASLEGDGSYQGLESALQTFLNREGVEGLIRTFLSQYVFDRIWVLIENHVDERTDTVANATAMASAVKAACGAHVDQEINDVKAQGLFNAVDWFGKGGRDLGEQIVMNLDSRLRAL